MPERSPVPTGCGGSRCERGTASGRLIGRPDASAFGLGELDQNPDYSGTLVGRHPIAFGNRSCLAMPFGAPYAGLGAGLARACARTDRSFSQVAHGNTFLMLALDTVLPKIQNLGVNDNDVVIQRWVTPTMRGPSGGNPMALFRMVILEVESTLPQHVVPLRSSHLDVDILRDWRPFC